MCQLKQNAVGSQKTDILELVNLLTLHSHAIRKMDPFNDSGKANLGPPSFPPTKWLFFFVFPGRTVPKGGKLATVVFVFFSVLIGNGGVAKTPLEKLVLKDRQLLA